MAQSGGTRGGTFHGEMVCCRESQGWTTACSRMAERDGKDQEEDSKASGLVLVRSPLLTSRKWRELVASGRLVCRCHDVFLWSYVRFVLLRFRIFAFIKAAALRSIVFRYAGAPIATRVFSSSFFFFFFPLLFIWSCRCFLRVFSVPLPPSL